MPLARPLKRHLNFSGGALQAALGIKAAKGRRLSGAGRPRKLVGAAHVAVATRRAKEAYIQFPLGAQLPNGAGFVGQRAAAAPQGPQHLSIVNVRRLGLD